MQVRKKKYTCATLLVVAYYEICVLTILTNALSIYKERQTILRVAKQWVRAALLPSTVGIYAACMDDGKKDDRFIVRLTLLSCVCAFVFEFHISHQYFKRKSVYCAGNARDLSAYHKCERTLRYTLRMRIPI